MKLLDKCFYDQDTIKMAQSLLGKFLFRESEEGLACGIIVETEAYLSSSDPACHAVLGPTKRNATMFGPAGRAYIYFIYGNYFCFNVVSGPVGKGEAVLIRAVQPIKGLELMSSRRGGACPINNLTTGPGKLCQAFHINKALDGHDLSKKPLFLAESNYSVSDYSIKSTPRIGISKAKDKELRFILSGNKFLSRRESLE